MNPGRRNAICCCIFAAPWGVGACGFGLGGILGSLSLGGVRLDGRRRNRRQSRASRGRPPSRSPLRSRSAPSPNAPVIEILRLHWLPNSGDWRCGRLVSGEYPPRGKAVHQVCAQERHLCAGRSDSRGLFQRCRRSRRRRRLRAQAIGPSAVRLWTAIDQPATVPPWNSTRRIRAGAVRGGARSTTSEPPRPCSAWLT